MTERGKEMRRLSRKRKMTLIGIGVIIAIGYFFVRYIQHMSIEERLGISDIEIVAEHKQDEGELTYNGQKYTCISNAKGCKYNREEVCIGRAGYIVLYKLKNDNEENYLVGYAPREVYIFSKKEKEIPIYGDITGVYIENKSRNNEDDYYSEDSELITKLAAVRKSTGEPYSFANYGCGSFSADIEFAYQGCLIADDNKFMRIAHLEDGRWVCANKFDSQKAMNIGFVIKNEEVIQLLESMTDEIVAW